MTKPSSKTGNTVSGVSVIIRPKLFKFVFSPWSRTPSAYTSKIAAPPSPPLVPEIAIASERCSSVNVIVHVLPSTSWIVAPTREIVFSPVTFDTKNLDRSTFSFGMKSKYSDAVIFKTPVLRFKLTLSTIGLTISGTSLTKMSKLSIFLFVAISGTASANTSKKTAPLLPPVVPDIFNASILSNSDNVIVIDNDSPAVTVAAPIAPSKANKAADTVVSFIFILVKSNNVFGTASNVSDA